MFILFYVGYYCLLNCSKFYGHLIMARFVLWMLFLTTVQRDIIIGFSIDVGSSRRHRQVNITCSKNSHRLLGISFFSELKALGVVIVVLYSRQRKQHLLHSGKGKRLHCRYKSPVTDTRSHAEHKCLRSQQPLRYIIL